MIPVLTGRQRTVALTGNIAGHILYGHNVYGHVVSDNLAGSNDVSMSLNCGGFGANFGMSGTHPFSINTQTPTWTITVDTGLGNTATDTQTGTLNDGDIWAVQDVGGSYSFSFVVEEIIDFDTNGVTLWPKCTSPNEAGTLKPFSTADAPFYGRYTVKECLVPGSSVVVRLTSAGRTVTATTVVAGAHALHQFTQYCNGSMSNANTYGSNPLAGTAGTATDFTCDLKWSWTSAFGNLSATPMPIPYTRTGPSSSVDCTTGTMKAHIEAAAFIGGVTYDRGATLTFEIWRSQVIKTNIKVSDLEKVYPLPLTILNTQRGVAGLSQSDVVTINGQGDAPVFTQERYSASSTLTGIVQDAITFNTQSPLFATIQSASLTANREDKCNTRILFRGHYAPTSNLVVKRTTIENCNELAVDTGTIYRTKSDNPYGFWQAQTGASIARSTLDGHDVVRIQGSNGVARYQQLHTDQLLTPPLKAPVWGLYGERWLDVTFRVIDPVSNALRDDKVFRVSIQTRGYEDGFDRVPMRTKRWILKGRTTAEATKGLYPQGWVTRRIDLTAPHVNDYDLGKVEGGANWATHDIVENLAPVPPGVQTTTEWTVQTDNINNQEASHDTVWPSPCLDTNIYGVSELSFVIPSEYPSGFAGKWSWLFDQVPDSCAVDLDDISAVIGVKSQCTFGHPYRWWSRGDRKDEPAASPDGAGDHWNPGYDGAALTDPIMKTRGFIQRYLLGYADGRQGPESPGFTRTETKVIISSVEYTSLTFAEPAISNAMFDLSGVVQINNNYWAFNSGTGKFDIYTSTPLGGMIKSPTWYWTDGNPAGKAIEDAGPAFMNLSDWMNQNRKLTWLNAMGWRYTRELESDPSGINAAGWKSGYDVDVQASQSLRAQFLTDRIDFYADCGDVFRFGSSTDVGQYGTTFYNAAGTTLRANGHGLCEFVNFTPAPAQRVKLFETTEPLPSPLAGGVPLGFQDTNTQGYYSTDQAHGIGGINHYLQHLSSKLARSYRHVFSRKRNRVSYIVALKCEVWNLHKSSGEFHRAFSQGNQIFYSRSDSDTPRPWVLDAIPILEGTEPRMIYDFSGILCMVFTRTYPSSTSVAQAFSYDDGFTWADGGDILDGAKHPTIAIAYDGLMIEASYLAGNIQLRRKFGGETWSAWNIITDSNGAAVAVEDGSFHLTNAYDSANRWVLSAVKLGDSTPSEWESFDDAQTWRII